MSKVRPAIAKEVLPGHLIEMPHHMLGAANRSHSLGAEFVSGHIPTPPVAYPHVQSSFAARMSDANRNNPNTKLKIVPEASDLPQPVYRSGDPANLEKYIGKYEISRSNGDSLRIDSDNTIIRDILETLPRTFIETLLEHPIPKIRTEAWRELLSRRMAGDRNVNIKALWQQHESSLRSHLENKNTNPEMHDAAHSICAKLVETLMYPDDLDEELKTLSDRLVELMCEYDQWSEWPSEEEEMELQVYAPIEQNDVSTDQPTNQEILPDPKTLDDWVALARQTSGTYSTDIDILAIWNKYKGNLIPQQPTRLSSAASADIRETLEFLAYTASQFSDGDWQKVAKEAQAILSSKKF